jgi:hypothetical protein
MERGLKSWSRSGASPVGHAGPSARALGAAVALSAPSPKVVSQLRLSIGMFSPSSFLLDSFVSLR